MASRNDPPGGWWRRGDRTRRHIYYRPTTNRQGKFLFALIALLGLAALGIAAFNMMRLHTLTHDDSVLGAVGIACILLGIWQIRALSR